ncbi:hypothetical protein RE428_02130 [Marinobacter nanhaiticus D15-8W]|nr:hypothetical protein RE428_02130 [Marinobacter nanhaiticus D15-8W]
MDRSPYDEGAVIFGRPIEASALFPAALLWQSVAFYSDTQQRLCRGPGMNPTDGYNVSSGPLVFDFRKK